MLNVCALTLLASLHATTANASVATMFAQAPTEPATGGQNDTLEPDRPDVTNGTHIVDVGVLQMEIGGLWTRNRTVQS